MDKISHQAQNLYRSLVTRALVGEGPDRKMGINDTLARITLESASDSFLAARQADVEQKGLVERQTRCAKELLMFAVGEQALLTEERDYHEDGAREWQTTRMTAESMDQLLMRIPGWGRATVTWIHVDKTEEGQHFKQTWIVASSGVSTF